MIFPILGLPGAKDYYQVSHSPIFRSAPVLGLAGGKIIDGTKSRDAGNTGATHVLRPGVLMGKITSGGKYRPSIIGKSNLAYADNDTTIQTDLATATEISRLKTLGGGGNLSLYFVGPPSAAGTVAETAITVTAVTLNGATSTITVGDLNLNKVSGSFFCPADGAMEPKTIISDGMYGYGHPVVDPIVDGDGLDVPFAEFPIGGTLISANIVNWPSDTSLMAWVFQKLNQSANAAGGNFTGDHLY